MFNAHLLAHIDFQYFDRMIIFIYSALLSLSNVVHMVDLSVETSTSVLALAFCPYNMVPTMVDRVVFRYEISLQRQSNAPYNVVVV